MVLLFTCRPALAAMTGEIVRVCPGMEVAQCTAEIDKEPQRFGARCGFDEAPSLVGEWDCEPVEEADSAGGLGDFMCRRTFACTSPPREIEYVDQDERSKKKGKRRQSIVHEWRSPDGRTSVRWTISGGLPALRAIGGGFARPARTRGCRTRKAGKRIDGLLYDVGPSCGSRHLRRKYSKRRYKRPKTKHRVYRCGKNGKRCRRVR